MIAGLKDAGGPALTEIGQASAHRLIETELDPMCEWWSLTPPDTPRVDHGLAHSRTCPLGESAGVYDQRGTAWLYQVGANTAYIEFDSRWENGFLRIFNGSPTDELLNRAVVYAVQ